MVVSQERYEPIPPDLKPCCFHSFGVCWIPELGVSLSTSVLPWSDGVAKPGARSSADVAVVVAAATSDDGEIVECGQRQRSGTFSKLNVCQINSAHKKNKGGVCLLVEVWKVGR